MEVSFPLPKIFLFPRLARTLTRQKAQRVLKKSRIQQKTQAVSDATRYPSSLSSMCLVILTKPFATEYLISEFQGGLVIILL